MYISTQYKRTGNPTLEFLQSAFNNWLENMVKQMISREQSFKHITHQREPRIAEQAAALAAPDKPRSTTKTSASIGIFGPLSPCKS